MVVGIVFMALYRRGSNAQCHAAQKWRTRDSDSDARTRAQAPTDYTIFHLPFATNERCKPHRFIVLVTWRISIAQGLGYKWQSKMPAMIFDLSFLPLSFQTQRGGTRREDLKKSCEFLFFPAQGVLCLYTIVPHS